VKIDNHVTVLGDSARTEALRRPKAPQVQPDPPPSSVLNLSLRVLAAQGALAAQPASDPARIAALKKAVAEGQYRIDAERLADRLIQGERARLAAAGR
jgi:flagellar biosynthesis anti-sigma factor FlgM